MSNIESTPLDVIIIGGGPAGLSASLWCQELGLASILLEKEAECGGQLLITHNPINNYLGVRTSEGRELGSRFLDQIARSGSHLLTSVGISSVDLSQKKVALDDGTVLSCRSMILAMGVRRRKLLVPGEEEFRGKGILASGAQNQDEIEQKVVVIVGGGDAALENALLLSRKAERVYLVHRGRDFGARSEFIGEARNKNNIVFIVKSQLVAILGDETVRSVELQDIASGDRRHIKTDHVLIRIGVIPNSEIVANQLELDEACYIRVNARFETNVAKVFAVGDVSNPISPTISSAVGAGASAAKAVRSFLASEMLK